MCTDCSYVNAAKNATIGECAGCMASHQQEMVDGLLGCRKGRGGVDDGGCRIDGNMDGCVIYIF